MERQSVTAAAGLVFLAVALLRADGERLFADGERGFATIREDDVEAHLALLCNPYLEGRDSPSFGLEFAAEQFAARFEELGLESPPDVEGHIAFYTRRMPTPDANGTRLVLPLEREVALGVDFTALLGCDGSAKGPAVFCGYGIGVKEFDELDDLDLAGAVAVFVEGEPRHKKVLRGPEITEAANLYRKLERLAEAGAAGALIVRRAHAADVPVPKDWPSRQPMGFRHTFAFWADGTVPNMGPSRIPALEISWELAEELLDDDLDARMASIDTKGKPAAFEGPRREVEIACATTETEVSLPNVVGIVRGSDATLANEYVIIGAHLDHIGADPLGRIGVGADDNASGSAALLEIVEALAAEPPPRSVLAVAFTSEEDGLLGSQALARKLPVPADAVVAMVNLDMIGRGPRNTCVALGVRENPRMQGVIDAARRRFKTGIKDVITNEGQELFARSDHYSFHQVGIPAVFFFEHVPISDNPDYHTWRDLPELVDTKKIANTARLAYGVVCELTELEERLERPARLMSTTTRRAAALLRKTGSVRAAAWVAAAVLLAAAIGAWTERNERTSEALEAPTADGGGSRSNGSPAAPFDGPSSPWSTATNDANSRAASTPVLPRRSADERPNAVDPLLERRVEALVGKAVTDAARFSKNEANSNTCVVALRVIDLADGAVVLERLARTPVAPASNQKLVTSLSALVELGLEWSFETHVDALGSISGDRLTGDLVVRAGGDPIFAEGDPDHADRRMAELAAAVAERVHSVSGDVVLDLTRFDDAAPAPGWPTVDPWTSSYALASGLCINGGLVSYEVAPTRAGARAAARLVPASTGLVETVDVATVAGRTNDVRVGLYESTGRLDLTGSIGASVDTYRGDFRHPDPVAYFGHVFARHLAAAGVRVDGGVRRERDVAAGERLATLTTPWTEYLVPINTHSNNAAADAVLMALGLASGGHGTRTAGAERVRDVLVELGTNIDGFVQIDGSGLSRDNRVTVEILSELLARVSQAHDELRAPFIDSLAIGGRTGTLANRMTGHAAGRVHGKTGFIRGASALSGFVRTEEERELVFSIVVNYPRLDALNNSCWKPMHDAIVEELVLWKRP